jgi:tripartite-type tricarboxylate transporter receptor subunit TctC
MLMAMKRIMLGTLILALCCGAIAADAFPQKPIRLIIPYPAGGTTDLMARALQESMQQSLGQPIIVENKAGASGAIAAQMVARSPADGYTLLFTNNGIQAVVPFVQKKAGFDPIKDFAPVSKVSSGPLVLVAYPNAPFGDVKQLVDYAKVNPNKVEYASAGIGSLGHLASEFFANAAGVKLLHVPYGGQAPTTMAVMTGEVKMLLTTSSSTMNGYIANGKLKLLGVSKPTKLFPNARPISEVVPGFEAESWFAILAPRGTPPDVVAKLNAAIVKAATSPDINEKYRAAGVEPTTSSPEQLATMLQQEVAKWAPIIKENHITGE